MDETTSAGHRQIELQSAEDFSHLIANLRRAAAEHISEAFPPVPSTSSSSSSNSPPGHQEDELRTQIEKLVDEYISRTFTLAAPNLVINGLPISDPALFLSGREGGAEEEPEEQFEKFDGRKRDRVQDLVKQEEDLLSEIAALKRRVPGDAALAWGERVRRGVEEDERVLEGRKGEVGRAVREGGVAATEAEGEGRRRKTGVLGDVGPLERQEGVERAFGSAVETLGRLKGDMPAAVAKMERARVAGEYVVTER